MKNAEIICIGDELLIGQVINTNAAWIAEQLNLIGVNVVQATTISDNRRCIIQTLKDAFKRADIILITGGLGPTKDDITKKTLADFFESDWKHDAEVEQHVRSLFEKRGYVVSDVNLAQADVPEKCTVLMNKMGTAPGMLFEENGKIVVSMPGVPYEMKYLVEFQVIPYLQAKIPNSIITHKTILTQGTGESVIAAQIEKWEDALPANVKLAYLPSPGQVRLRLTAKGNNKKETEDLANKLSLELKELLGDIVFGEDNETLASVIHRLFKEKKITLSSAESCTGGAIAHKITQLPGASEFFVGSAIVYTNKLKTELLNVEPQLIESYSPVSEQVARAMITGAIEKLGSDYAVSSTGFAGPDGGTTENPVGTIYIGVGNKTSQLIRKLTLGNNRERNIEIASLSALQLLRKLILNSQ